MAPRIGGAVSSRLAEGDTRRSLDQHAMRGRAPPNAHRATLREQRYVVSRSQRSASFSSHEQDHELTCRFVGSGQRAKSASRRSPEAPDLQYGSEGRGPAAQPAASAAPMTHRRDEAVRARRGRGRRALAVPLRRDQDAETAHLTRRVHRGLGGEPSSSQAVNCRRNRPSVCRTRAQACRSYRPLGELRRHGSRSEPEHATRTRFDWMRVRASAGSSVRGSHLAVAEHRQGREERREIARGATPLRTRARRSRSQTASPAKSCRARRSRNASSSSPTER